MVRFIDRRDPHGTPVPRGWICRCPGCDKPGRAIVDEDGRWCYVAACDNEQHAADALALHEETRSTPDMWDEYHYPTGEEA